MSELLSYYQICPVTNELIGLSEDCDENSVVVTMGKKIVYIMKHEHHKQLLSWNTVEHEFTCPVIYDFAEKRYVGVLSNIYLKFWTVEMTDLNKLKKVKMHKSIHSLLNVYESDRHQIMVLYEDGSSESLESAMESRNLGKQEETKNKLLGSKWEKVQVSGNILSFVKKTKQARFLHFCTVDPVTLKSTGSFTTIKMERQGANANLMDYTVILTKNKVAKLITFWSDNRLFSVDLIASDDDPSVGTLHSILSNINTSKCLGIESVGNECIAIYASRDDGAVLILYNLKYKVTQSRVMFKVHFFNFKLWAIKNNIYLVMGEQLSMIPFRLATDKLADMIGSQVDSKIPVFVEKEMVDEDPINALEFDDDQSEIADMQMKLVIPKGMRKKKKVKIGKAIESLENALQNFNELKSKEIYVDLLRDDDQFSDTIVARCTSNIDENFPILSENFELICAELESLGFSEMEITDKTLSILIAANRAKDIGLLMKRYNHISEKSLVKILKYLLTCSEEKDETVQEEVLESNGFHEENLEVEITYDKKFNSGNILLSTKQEERRDILRIALSCSFNSKTILHHLRRELNLYETIDLIDNVYSILNADMFGEYDFRGNLVDGEDFDIEGTLFEWFTLLLDSHYQQFLLSKDVRIVTLLEKWMKLVDFHIQILKQMVDLRPILMRISKNKKIFKKKSCNRWYKISKLPLY